MLESCFDNLDIEFTTHPAYLSQPNTQWRPLLFCFTDRQYMMKYNQVLWIWCAFKGQIQLFFRHLPVPWQLYLTVFSARCDIPQEEFVWWCLIPLSTIFQLYRGGQFYWWWKPEDPENPTDRSQIRQTWSHNVVHLAPIEIRNNNIRGDRHRLHW